MAEWRISKWVKRIRKPVASKPGSVAGPDVKPEVSSEEKSPTTGTFATAVMEAIGLTTSSTPPKSTISATSTISPGSSSTESIPPLPIAVTMSSEELESLTLSNLSPKMLDKLNTLASGRGEPIGEVIRQIAQYLIEDEGDFEEKNLVEGVSFYLENEVL